MLNAIVDRIEYIKSDEHWYEIAVQNYNNPHLLCLEDFNDDLRRFSHVQSLLNKYNNKNGLNERLIINHIIILSNLFGCQACIDLLYYKIDKKYWSILNSFLWYLQILDCEYERDLQIDLLLEKL